MPAGAPSRGGIGSQLIHFDIPVTLSVDEVLDDWYGGSPNDSWTKFVPTAAGAHTVLVQNHDPTKNPTVKVYDKGLALVGSQAGAAGVVSLSWNAVLASAPYYIVASDIQVGISSLTINLAALVKCATPTFTQLAGALALGSLTAGAIIVFRLNTAAAWRRYTQPLRLSATTGDVWAKALKDGLRESDVSHYTFTNT